MPDLVLRRGYADTELGQLHYAEAGAGTGAPLILLHQTPRSLDEFAELQPLLARERRVIAMDMYGFGHSAKPPAPQTIEQYAAGVLALADALDLPEFAVLGHHTGAFVAGEVAAAAPGRVTALILSGAEYADDEFRRAETAAEPTVDHAPTREDGHHLVALWNSRRPLYPAGRPDVLNRYIRDALAPGVDPLEGHVACARYAMEDRAGSVTAPVLILAATDDPVSYPHTEKVRKAYGNAPAAEVHEVRGGMIPLMEQKAPEIAPVVLDFLDRFDG